MKKARRQKKGGRTLKIASIVVLAILLVGAYLLFAPMAHGSKRTYIFIDDDDTADSVYQKVSEKSSGHAAWTFRKLGAISGYGSNIHTGRYEIGNGGALATFRRIRNGLQAPVNLTINSVRTVDRLAADISKKMMFSKQELLQILQNRDSCAKYGY